MLITWFAPLILTFLVELELEHLCMSRISGENVILGRIVFIKYCDNKWELHISLLTGSNVFESCEYSLCTLWMLIFGRYEISLCFPFEFITHTQFAHMFNSWKLCFFIANYCFWSSRIFNCWPDWLRAFVHCFPRIKIIRFRGE